MKELHSINNDPNYEVKVTGWLLSPSNSTIKGHQVINLKIVEHKGSNTVKTLL